VVFCLSTSSQESRSLIPSETLVIICLRLQLVPTRFCNMSVSYSVVACMILPPSQYRGRGRVFHFDRIRRWGCWFVSSTYCMHGNWNVCTGTKSSVTWPAVNSHACRLIQHELLGKKMKRWLDLMAGLRKLIRFAGDGLASLVSETSQVAPSIPEWRE